MKSSRLFIGACLALGIIVLAWQTSALFQLRSDVEALRKDLQVVVHSALATSANPASESGQASREKLELIKLRNQVRELNESRADSHTQGSKTGLGAAIQVLLAPSANAGPWKIRPEWKGMEASLTNQYAKAMKTLNGATNDYVRFLSLNRVAKMCLAVGQTEEARQFANDMLVLDDKYSRGVPEKANGDVVHDANLVLGRIAVDEGRIEEAKQRLLAAGKTSGSPVLSSFGPNMSLARDLLSKNEPATVLQYFDLCRKFWTFDGGKKLDEWTKDIDGGRIPEFGPNLIY